MEIRVDLLKAGPRLPEVASDILETGLCQLKNVRALSTLTFDLVVSRVAPNRQKI